MRSASLVLIMFCGVAGALPAWEFDTAADLQDWVPNGHLDNISVSDGAVHADAVDWDPFFVCSVLNFPATHWQYVVVRIKADAGGRGELFWTGETEGQYGGFSGEKSTFFTVPDDSAWHEIPIFCFWQPEGVMRQFRLDLYEGAHFDIDYIRVVEWGADTPVITDQYAWEFGGDASAWEVHPNTNLLLSPRLNLPVSGATWVSVAMRSDTEGRAAFSWAAPNVREERSIYFTVQGDGELHWYNLRMLGYPSWSTTVDAIGVRMPAASGVSLESLRLTDAPQGPPQLAVQYLGAENGVNRSGSPRSVLAQFQNVNGVPSGAVTATLTLPEGMHFADGESAVKELEPLDYQERGRVRWSVVADAPGAYALTLETTGEGAAPTQTAEMRFLAPLGLPASDYVPAPRPIETSAEICAYYFPGWEPDAKWDPIRDVAPIRKPVLGYYREGDPECVDWQIKWARENGISCFLVDWYWVGGYQFLNHWFDAYREARYRDQLEVAIMWANHNPDGTHSREDWRNVTQEWIDHYFNLPAYYQIDGKPAVFIWAPANIKNDLGGNDEVAAALEESQTMARAAGYEGIVFVAVNYNRSVSEIEDLIAQGYSGTTSYHEWGNAVNMAPTENRPLFSDVVATAPATWEEKEAASDALTYYPVADTGWDSEPWHGDEAMDIEGRTIAGFEQLLDSLKLFGTEHDRDILVLGPLNEWGEGSYIEPCTEWDFGMYEAVRKAFGVGEPGEWPVNVAPADVGLGPYDYPPQPEITPDWTFDNDAEGWQVSFSGMTNFRVEESKLAFDFVASDHFDPVLNSPSGLDVDAKDLHYLLIDIDLGWGDGSASCGATTGLEFYWDSGEGMNAQARIPFDVHPNLGMHRVILDLSEHPLWEGTINQIRVDPGTDGINLPGNTCRIDRIALLAEPDAYRWDFEQNTTQGWCAAGSGSVSVSDGLLRFHYAEGANGHFDPIIMYTYQSTDTDRLLVNADANPYVRIDVGMTHSSSAPVPLAFRFWQTDGAIGRVGFDIEPNAGVKTYIVDMRDAVQVQGDAAWAGADAIPALRLDTAQTSVHAGFESSELQVDMIALTDGSGDADGDGISDADELDDGTDPGDDDDPGTPPVYHSADVNADGALSVDEMLGVVRLFHAGAYHCDGASAYLPGEGDTTACAPHDADYQPTDWRIELSELMRVVQLHNAGAYHACVETAGEDGFCVGAAAG